MGMVEPYQYPNKTIYITSIAHKHYWCRSKSITLIYQTPSLSKIEINQTIKHETKDVRIS